MRQNNGHDAVLLQVMEAVQQKGEVRRRSWRESVVFEAGIIGHVLFRGPAIAERWIGDDCVKLRHFGRIGLAQHVPVVCQRVAVKDGKRGVAHAVQQHVHAGEALCDVRIAF